MTRPLPTLRCERPSCDNAATHTASRVDAIRDHWYLCDEHAIAQPSVFEPSALPPRRAELVDEREPVWALETLLVLFPPKHRGVTKRAAREIAARPRAVTS